MENEKIKISDLFLSKTGNLNPPSSITTYNNMYKNQSVNQETSIIKFQKRARTTKSRPMTTNYLLNKSAREAYRKDSNLQGKIKVGLSRHIERSQRTQNVQVTNRLSLKIPKTLPGGINSNKPVRSESTNKPLTAVNDYNQKIEFKNSRLHKISKLPKEEK